MIVHVDEVHSARVGGPLLLHFQNGYVTDSFLGSGARAKLLSDGEKSVVAADIGDVLYAGEQEEEDLGKTLLLVRNKKNGKVRVMEVGSVSMRAVVHSALIASTESQEVNNLEVSRKFGSKRDKKRMEQQEKLKMNTQTMTDQLKQVAEDVSAVEKIDLNAYTKTDTEDYYVPPINRDAHNVEDVYEISKILSEDDVEKITSEIVSKDYKSELHPYMKTFTRKMTNTETALLLYANCLLKMYLSNMRDIGKKAYTICSSSHTLNEICCDNFTVLSNGKRSRSNQYKDKTLCHLIVFILLLNNFKFEIDTFSTAVKISPGTIIMKTRAVGAHISSDKKSVTLKLPLSTAKSFLSGRRKSAKF